MLLSLALTLSLIPDGPARPPFPTGTHLQLVRTEYTAKHGLPADDARAVAVTRKGFVLAAAGGRIARLTNGRWVVMDGPEGVTALFAPRTTGVPPESGIRRDAGGTGLGIQQDAGSTGDAAPLALVGAKEGVWALLGDVWSREPNSPAAATWFAAEPDGTVWALAPSGFWRRPSRGWELVDPLDDEMAGPKAICPMGPNSCYVADPAGLFELTGKRKYWLKLEVRPEGLPSADVRAVTRLGGGQLLVATDKGLTLTNGKRGWRTLTGADGLPILDLTAAHVAADGTVWLGSPQGLIRWKDGAWTYLAGRRWLADDKVQSIAAGPDGSVWVATPKGVSHLRNQSLTLAEKAAIYQRDTEKRPRRFDFVTILHLASPGVLEGATQEISDNDGLWTALYMASQSYRYAVTKDPAARAQAWRSMQAVLRLESITGIKGFPARAICHESEKTFRQRNLDSDDEWHASPVEKGWWWKGETSSDEIAGHYYGWYVFYELAATEDQKKAVRATCKRVTDHLLDNNYYLLDLDGKPTTWGFWGPDRLNDDPKCWEERGLGSLEMLSHLKVAMHIVGDPRYKKAYDELVREHHYALNVVDTRIAGAVSHDNQLAYLAFYPILELERDPALVALYRAGLKKLWSLTRIEANPLWNFFAGAGTGEPCDAEAAVKTLREIPLDLINWKVKNSHRADIRWQESADRRGRHMPVAPLNFYERSVEKWDGTPYTVDAGSDLAEIDQTMWLLPYWKGRYHRLIE